MEVIKSNLCDYNDDFILVRGDINIVAAKAYWVTQVAFKNCAPFTKCTINIDQTTIDDARDVDLVMPMYDLIKYNSNYSDTAGSLRFYSKDKATVLMLTLQIMMALSLSSIRLNH